MAAGLSPSLLLFSFTDVAVAPCYYENNGVQLKKPSCIALEGPIKRVVSLSLRPSVGGGGRALRQLLFADKICGRERHRRRRHRRKRLICNSGGGGEERRGEEEKKALVSALFS